LISHPIAKEERKKERKNPSLPPFFFGMSSPLPPFFHPPSALSLQINHIGNESFQFEKVSFLMVVEIIHTNWE
jgi:hypothetical protein